MVAELVDLPLPAGTRVVNVYASAAGILIKTERTEILALVAELVDALVSNTNVFGRAGSTPAQGTKAFLFHERAFFIQIIE